MSDGGTTVLEVAGLLEYQEGSIVSRQVMKGPGGSVTAFAFAAGEGLSEHTTPHEALIQVVDGSAVIEVGGEAHDVDAGELIRLPAGVPHAVQARRRFKMILTMIRTIGSQAAQT
jgi:quercetin dioxygenase-like cupin family protein